MIKKLKFEETVTYEEDEENEGIKEALLSGIPISLINVTQAEGYSCIVYTYKEFLRILQKALTYCPSSSHVVLYDVSLYNKKLLFTCVRLENMDEVIVKDISGSEMMIPAITLYTDVICKCPEPALAIITSKKKI